MIREFDIQGTQVWSGRRDMGSGWPDPFISQTPHSVVMVGGGGGGMPRGGVSEAQGLGKGSLLVRMVLMTVQGSQETRCPGWSRRLENPKREVPEKTGRCDKSFLCFTIWNVN